MLTEFVAGIFRSRPAPTTRVRELTTWRELEPWRATWTDLYDRTADANFFQSWLWLKSYWRHFGHDQQLRILIVEETDGTPIGILPLTIQSESHAIGNIRRLGFLLDNWGTSFGPLGPNPSASFAAGVQYALDRRGDWDVFDLRWIPARHCDDVIAAFRGSSMHFQRKLWSRIACINLTTGWDEYCRSRTSKWRNNQRRLEKALRRMGEVRFVHFRPEPNTTDPRWDLYGLCERVASLSWQGASSSGNTLSHPHVRAFLREVHAAAVAAGRVHLSLLLVGNEPAAFNYNYLSHGTVHGLRTGYDLRFQRAGPGTVLLRETIRECISRGDHTFDLGESPSLYKRHWGNEWREAYRFSHYSLSNSIAKAMGR